MSNWATTGGLEEILDGHAASFAYSNPGKMVSCCGRRANEHQDWSDMKGESETRWIPMTRGAGFVRSHLCGRLIGEIYVALRTDNFTTGSGHRRCIRGPRTSGGT